MSAYMNMVQYVQSKADTDTQKINASVVSRVLAIRNQYVAGLSAKQVLDLYQDEVRLGEQAGFTGETPAANTGGSAVDQGGKTKKSVGKKPKDKKDKKKKK